MNYCVIGHIYYSSLQLQFCLHCWELRVDLNTYLELGYAKNKNVGEGGTAQKDQLI